MWTGLCSSFAKLHHVDLPGRRETALGRLADRAKHLSVSNRLMGSHDATSLAIPNRGTAEVLQSAGVAPHDAERRCVLLGHGVDARLELVGSEIATGFQGHSNPALIIPVRAGKPPGIVQEVTFVRGRGLEA